MGHYINTGRLHVDTQRPEDAQGHVLRRPFEVIRGTSSQDAARGNTQNCMSARDVSDTQNSYRLELVVLKTCWEVSACGATLPDETYNTSPFLLRLRLGFITCSVLAYAPPIWHFGLYNCR